MADISETIKWFDYQNWDKCTIARVVIFWVDSYHKV